MLIYSRWAKEPSDTWSPWHVYNIRNTFLFGCNSLNFHDSLSLSIFLICICMDEYMYEKTSVPRLSVLEEISSPASRSKVGFFYFFFQPCSSYESIRFVESQGRNIDDINSRMSSVQFLVYCMTETHQLFPFMKIKTTVDLFLCIFFFLHRK